ncbi:DUF4595 domain-containing protein [Sphingobacterium sp. MYb382]|uniref:DUF4595 domain-containing protein n=1 Tax=Sphingobacterium sp. MYb382 TaxID=2745278 RepID=UPI0030A270D2
MKKLGLLLFTASIFLGCSKDDKNDIPQVEGCLVTKLTILPAEIDDSKFIASFNYDQSGRINAIKSNSIDNGENDEVLITFNYTANKITAVSKEAGDEDEILEFTLDDKGRITAGKEVREKGESLAFNFTYNPAGQLEKTTETYNNKISTEEYLYTNTNLTSLKNASGNFSLSYDLTKKYTPYSTVTSPYSTFSEFENIQLLVFFYETGFLGKKSTNRITSIKHNDGLTIPFTYKDDAQGNATSITTIVENTPVIHLLEYYCR